MTTLQNLLFTPALTFNIQVIKNKKNPKTITDYAKLIQLIKKEYQKLALENEILKKKLKKVEDKQLTNDLINHHKKQQEHFEVLKEEKGKGTMKTNSI